MGQKRIIDLASKEVVLDGDYFVVDNGSQSFKISSLQLLNAYLQKNMTFSGNNNFLGENTFVNQALSDSSQKAATTKFVNDFSDQNLIGKEFLSAGVLAAPNGVITLGADEESVDIQAGLKLLVPNGKNTDGTNKHIIYTVPSTINSGSYMIVNIGLGAFLNISNGTVIKKKYLGKFLVAPDVEGSASYYNISENKYYTSGYDDGVWTETLNIIYLGSLDENRPEVYIPERFYGYILVDVVPVMKIITNQDLLDLAFPVNTIIEGCSANPGLLIGGIWAEYGQGQVTVGQDTSQAEFATVGNIGGEKTHTLTSAESGLPAHSHSLNGIAAAYYPHADVSPGAGIPRVSGGQVSATLNNTATNASSAHNNLQPYIVVKRWKRTA